MLVLVGKSIQKLSISTNTTWKAIDPIG